jgi:ring-1,2-phenylacetyl-CoA epoxidase subunit PaaC
VTRNLLFGAYQLHLWEALQRSRDSELAAIAGKSIKESRYHLRHAVDWTVRLGDGTEESHARMQAALDLLWPYTGEFFAADALDEAAAADGFGVPAGSLQGPWEDTVRPVLEEATLRIPEPTPFRSRGKGGMHSEHMGHLLAEMQYMQRTYPGLQW